MTGYIVFLVAAGRMKTAPILREICYIANVVPSKDVKIHED
jgi:hypothetical protein